MCRGTEQGLPNHQASHLREDLSRQICHIMGVCGSRIHRLAAFRCATEDRLDTHPEILTSVEGLTQAEAESYT